MLNQQGQSSFEILLLVAFITGLSAVVIVNYLDISPSVYGTAIVKSDVLRQLTEKGSTATIDSVAYSLNGNVPAFSITLNPRDCSLIDLTTIRTVVQSQSGLSTATVTCVS